MWFHWPTKAINFDYIFFGSFLENTIVPSSLWKSMYGFVSHACLTFRLWSFWVFWVSLGLWSRLLVNDQKWVIDFFWAVLHSATLEVTWCFYVQWAEWVFHLWKSMWVTCKMRRLGLRTTNLDAAQDLNHLLTQDAAAKLAIWDETVTILSTDKRQIGRYHKLSSNEMFWCMKTSYYCLSSLFCK